MLSADSGSIECQTNTDSATQIRSVISGNLKIESALDVLKIGRSHFRIVGVDQPDS